MLPDLIVVAGTWWKRVVEAVTDSAPPPAPACTSRAHPCCFDLLYLDSSTLACNALHLGRLVPVVTPTAIDFHL